MPDLLAVRDLVKHFPVRRGLLGRRAGVVHAVDGISFDLAERETLGLVGESGCGKSTAGLAILRLIEPTAGQVWFQGQDVAALNQEQLRQARRSMQIVFQDPYGSLNPRLTVARLIEEPLLNHERLSRPERLERAAEALRLVGLLPEHLDRFPHEFSGGQRQRVCLARALVLKPKLIIGDEPVSALDVSVQAQVLNLMARLQAELDLTMIFVSHDLAVIRHVSRRVAVMYLGQIVESAPAQDLFAEPLHPYAQALLAAVPVPNPRRGRRRRAIVGDVPSPLNPPPGCRFHPRCPERMDRCAEEEPVARVAGSDRVVKCHLYDQGPVWRPGPVEGPAA